MNEPTHINPNEITHKDFLLARDFLKSETTRAAYQSTGHNVIVVADKPTIKTNLGYGNFTVGI